MIDICLMEKNNRIGGFTVSGHSGTALKGEDIVCAGVSALAQSALLGLGEHLKRNIKYEVKSGRMFVKLLDEPDELTEAILKTMALGLYEIEKLYPEAVRVKNDYKL